MYIYLYIYILWSVCSCTHKIHARRGDFLSLHEDRLAQSNGAVGLLLLIYKDVSRRPSMIATSDNVSFTMKTLYCMCRVCHCAKQCVLQSVR